MDRLSFARPFMKLKIHSPGTLSTDKRRSSFLFARVRCRIVGRGNKACELMDMSPAQRGVEKESSYSLSQNGAKTPTTLKPC